MVIINTLNLKIPAMKSKSLLCLFLIISVAIHGNIYFKHLGKSDGLSQISVLSICQDELDRMWFGTLEGLNCYDGNQMKTYKPSPDNKDYFGGNEISHIVSDKQGNLFFTSDGKLIRYDLHKDRFLSLPLRTQTLFAHNHTIWTAVNDSVFQWDREQETFRFVYQAPFHKTIIRLYVDANNSLWLGTRNGLYRTDNIHNPSSPRLRDSKYQRAFIIPGQPWNDVGGHLPQRHVQDRERNQPAIYHPKGIRYLQQ